MAKKGVYKITGNTHPKTGEKTVYQVTEWYPDTPNSERRDALVTWELFKKNDKGQFVTTHIKKKGIGEFTFGKQSYESTFMLEGYLHSPERKEPMAIIVHPQKNDAPTSKERDIIGVKLTYQDGSNITKALSYMDRLRATVKCQNLEGQHLTLSLWEDDEKHEGHNKKNQFITKSPPIEVDSRGYARWNFTLLSTYISLANKREDDKKQHEYYILAEYNGKLQASGNVNVNNPEYKVPSKTPQPAPAKKPQPKPDTPKGSTHQGSSNNQPDKKGIIKKITLVDKDGKPFKRRPTFGQTIKLIIEAENVVGKKYNLKLWEHDSWGGDDLLYNNTHTFKADRQEVLIPLTHEMQTIGEIGIDPKNPNYGEYWTGNWQEIYAEVTLLYISTKSPIINVDIEEKPKVLDNGRSAWKMEKSEVEKEEKGKCPRCKSNFTWDEIKGIFGESDKDFRMECIQWINKYKLDFEINTCAKKAHFLSQIAAETHFRKDEMREGKVKYTPKNVRSGIFGDRGRLLDKRGQIEEFCKQRPEQVKLLNFLYAKENGFGNGNGNEASGDGFNFRGKGLIQLTGKGNYKSAMALIKEYVPLKIYDELLKTENRKKHYDKFDFEENKKQKTLKEVDLLDFIAYYDMPTEPKYAVLSALADWKGKGLSNSSLMVNDENKVKTIRKIINSAGLNTDVAKDYFNKAVINLKVNQCTDNKKTSSSNEKGTVVLVSGIDKKTEKDPVVKGLTWVMYKTSVYRNISLATFKKQRSANKLPIPDYITYLSRDTHQTSSSKGEIFEHSDKRFGKYNEIPPGEYYLVPGTDGQKYKIYVIDSESKSASSENGIDGPDGSRGGVALHHYCPRFSVGCFTFNSGKNTQPVANFVNEIPDLALNDDKPVHFIIESRQVKESKWEDPRYGTKKWTGI